jgi:hypothetical protein
MLTIHRMAKKGCTGILATFSKTHTKKAGTEAGFKKMYFELMLSTLPVRNSSG